MKEPWVIKSVNICVVSCFFLFLPCKPLRDQFFSCGGETNSLGKFGSEEPVRNWDRGQSVYFKLKYLAPGRAILFLAWMSKDGSCVKFYTGANSNNINEGRKIIRFFLPSLCFGNKVSLIFNQINYLWRKEYFYWSLLLALWRTVVMFGHLRLM